MSIPGSQEEVSQHDPERGGGRGPRRFSLPLRLFLILLLAVGAGVGAGLLLAWAGAAPGQAILGGVAGFAAALHFFNGIIE